MAERAQVLLPTWLTSIESVSLRVIDEWLPIGGDLRIAVQLQPPTVTVVACIQLVLDGDVAHQWDVVLPLSETILKLPQELQAGPCIVSLKKDDWELDAGYITIVDADDMSRGRLYDDALDETDEFRAALSEKRYDSAALHARSAAACYFALKSPDVAAAILRDCASATLQADAAQSGALALEAAEYFRRAANPEAAQLATRLAHKALATLRLAISSRVEFATIPEAKFERPRGGLYEAIRGEVRG